MSAAENKRQVQAIFSALAEGKAQPFWDSLSDDVVWTVQGTTSWSGSFAGKEAVRTQIFKPLREVLDSPPRTRVERILADEDQVVVLGRGDNKTRTGVRYDNVYCLVFQLAEGRVTKVTEFLDTELMARALGERPAPTT
ncbi:MAG TPA: nuclear transport factor 2 family protein [Polyangiales bacterium]